MSIHDIDSGGSEFVTVDPQQAEHVIQESDQVTRGVRISGHHDGFRVAQRSLAANRTPRTAIAMRLDVDSIAPRPRAGGAFCHLHG